MNQEQNRSSNGQDSDVQSSLMVKDLVQYLSSLVKLNRNDKTGNLELSDGLRQLVKALRPHAYRSVLELVDVLGEKRLSDGHESSKRIKATLPPDLKSVSFHEIENILDDSSYSKIQLVELGVYRFGISHSKLARLNRSGVQESIRAALDHETSLNVISQEARRSGTNRLS